MKMIAIWEEKEWSEKEQKYIVTGKHSVTIIQITQHPRDETMVLAVTTGGRMIEESIEDFRIVDLGL